MSRARYLYTAAVDAVETRRKGRLRFAARELLEEVTTDQEAGYLFLALADKLGALRGANYLVALEKVAEAPLLLECRFRCQGLAAIGEF